MPTVNGKPYVGPLVFDFTQFKDKLIDLPQGAMSRLRQEKEGLPDVIVELAKAFPADAKDAGISPDLYTSFQAHTSNITAMRLELAKLHKVVEVLTESIAKEEHDRENDVSLMVKTAKETASARSRPELLAPFESTIKYNSQSAEKAVHTRRKNEEAKKLEEEAAKKGTPPDVPAGDATPKPV